MSKPKKLTPNRTDFNYLVGWFLPDATGDHKRAKVLAKAYLDEHPPSVI